LRLASGYVPLITDMISGKSRIAQMAQFLRQNNDKRGARVC